MRWWSCAEVNPTGWGKSMRARLRGFECISGGITITDSKTSQTIASIRTRDVTRTKAPLQARRGVNALKCRRENSAFDAKEQGRTQNGGALRQVDTNERQLAMEHQERCRGANWQINCAN